MKKILLLSLFVYSVFSCFGKLPGKSVGNAKIDGNFKIFVPSKGITLLPNKQFSMKDFIEHDRDFAPIYYYKMGQGHIGAAVFFYCLLLPVDFILFPFIMPAIYHKPTKHRLGKRSVDIVIIRPNGDKYNAKLAFYKVKKGCAEYSSDYYNISLPDAKFNDLDNGMIASFSQYDICGKFVTWVIWGITKAN